MNNAQYSFGFRLRQARESLGLSQEEVAERIGASRISVTRWESNRGSARPSLYYRRELCKLFRKEMDDLFPLELKLPVEQQIYDKGDCEEGICEGEISLTVTRITASMVTDDSPLKNQFEEIVAPDEQVKTFEPSVRAPSIDMLPMPSLFETHPLNDQTRIIDDQEEMLDSQEKHIEFQKKYIEDTIATVNKLIDLFEPQCDPAVRAMVVKKFVLEISFTNPAEKQSFMLPEPHTVLDALHYAQGEHNRSQAIEEQRQRASYQMTDQDVRDALEHLGNLSMLGASKLVQTHYVSSRLQKDMSLVRRAQLVSEFLREGLELLRPDGVRTDTDSFWRFYNILYYLYFKSYLSNNQVAARLGMSLRQFYREKQKAFEMFFCHLHDIEAASHPDKQKVATPLDGDVIEQDLIEEAGSCSEAIARAASLHDEWLQRAVKRYSYINSTALLREALNHAHENSVRVYPMLLSYGSRQTDMTTLDLLNAYKLCSDSLTKRGKIENLSDNVSCKLKVLFISLSPSNNGEIRDGVKLIEKHISALFCMNGKKDSRETFWDRVAKTLFPLVANEATHMATATLCAFVILPPAE